MLSMAGWSLTSQKLINPTVLQENDKMLLSQKPAGLELIQNCDLPPPVKVFARSNKAVLTSMNRICSMMGKEEEEGDEFNVSKYGDESEKLALLKALRLSQTRAREAERKKETLAKEKDRLCNALLEESSKLFAYRQLVKLLELQVSRLQRQREKQLEKRRSFGFGQSDDENEGGVKWTIALALCLGVVGVGFAFGCSYLF